MCVKIISFEDLRTFRSTDRWSLKLDGQLGQVFSSSSGAGEALIAFQLCVTERLVPLSSLSAVDLLMPFEVLDATEALATSTTLIGSLASVDALMSL